jgi:hypothetical protein
MFGYDTVWNYFCDDVGKVLYTDHKVLNFWTVAKNVFGYSDFITRQRCFGTKNAHRYLLDYLSQYISNYSSHNRFAYIHISVAHEDTNTVYKTVDDDMKGFLEKFFEYYNNNDEDFVLMIAGDHGKGVKDKNYQELTLELVQPLHLMIANQGLINRIGAHEILMHNTERLVSRFDWHVTLKHLALLPYGNIDINSDTYLKFKGDTDSKNAVSLLLEKIPDDRQCSDVNIENDNCICRTYENTTLAE